jgi:hypothetical protein
MHYDSQVFECVDWSLRGAYMEQRHGITAEVANDALGDANRVVIDPDYNSTTGRSVRIIGFSVIADDIITVIVLKDEGFEYGVTGGWLTRRTAASTTKEDSMSKKIDSLLAAEAKAAEEAEATSDIEAPLPAHVRVTRGHPRAKNLQVRFRDDEYDQLAAYAEHRGLPVSTVVRMLVLQAIAPADDLKSALDRLESDLAAVRRRALSA